MKNIENRYYNFTLFFICLWIYVYQQLFEVIHRDLIDGRMTVPVCTYFTLTIPIPHRCSHYYFRWLSFPRVIFFSALRFLCLAQQLKYNFYFHPPTHNQIRPSKQSVVSTSIFWLSVQSTLYFQWLYRFFYNLYDINTFIIPCFVFLVSINLSFKFLQNHQI
jgi:hypothetical protein